MRRRFPGFFAAALLTGAAALCLGGEVVVLKGGTVIPLKQPMVRRGSTVYITRADGTLLSVPSSEIDRDATAAANRAPAAPAAPTAAPAASNPADAARAKDGQKARVRITDADVSHPLDLGQGEEKAKKEDTGTGTARVEVGDYSRDQNGGTLVIKGSLRNPGQGTAENVRLQISAMDEKGQSIDGTNATLSKGSLDSGTTVEFTASLNVGERTVASLRFQPTWTPPKPPPSAAKPGTPGAAPSANAAPNVPPAPRPTPYGLGSVYAAPNPSASTERPKDSNTGYLPGVSSPDNQPKPPTP